MPRKFRFKAYRIPEHLELVHHRVHRVARERGFTPEHMLRELSLTREEFTRLITRRHPPADELARVAEVLGCEPETLEECVPFPSVRTPRNILTKLLRSDDRALDRFCGYKLNPDLRRTARAKLAEIQDAIEAKRELIDAGRAPYIIDQAKDIITKRYQLKSRGLLDIYLDRSHRWREELEREIAELTEHL